MFLGKGGDDLPSCHCLIFGQFTKFTGDIGWRWSARLILFLSFDQHLTTTVNSPLGSAIPSTRNHRTSQELFMGFGQLSTQDNRLIANILSDGVQCLNNPVRRLVKTNDAARRFEVRQPCFAVL